MRRAISALLGAALLLLSAGLPASAAKRVALVIGIDEYDHLPVLQKAVNDEKAVAAALSELGFEVITGENLTRREMNAKLSELDTKIAPGDTVFFFFAGHGVALGAENYLLPSDLPKPRDGDQNLVRDEGHSVDAIVRRVQGQGAAVSFFVLDACRDNPLAASGVRSIGGTRGLTRVDAPKGVFVLFSAGLGQTALDRLTENDPNPNSVFTRRLVPLLKTPGVSHVRLAKRVQREVDELAATVHHPQQPAYYDQIIGEIRLSPGEAPEGGSDAQARPPAADPVIAAWNAAKDTQSVSVLEAFIDRFGDSFYASLARARLEELKKKEADKTIAVAPAETPGVVEAAPSEAKKEDKQEVAMVAPPQEPAQPDKPVKPAVGIVPKPETRSPVELVASTPSGQLKNPYQNPTAVAEEGHRNYLKFSCNGCHGGSGGGGMGPPLTNKTWIYGNDDDTLFRLIALGTDELQGQGFVRKQREVVLGPMPPYDRIIKSSDDIWKIIAWLRVVSAE